MNLPVLLKRIVFYSLLIYAFYSLSITTRDIYSLSSKESEKVNKITSLEDQKEKKNLELNYLNSDEFVEKEARTKLNMKKENEQVFVVPVESSSQNSDSNNVLGAQKSRSNLQKWMEVLF